MSIRLMSDVWRTSLPTVEKMVLLVIADHANDEGTQSYPSQATIASKASISIRTVQRSVNNLVERGFIRMFKGAGGSANCREDRRPHLYQININKLRADIVTGRSNDANGVTLTAVTGGQSRPMNHPTKTSIKPSELFEEFWKIYPRKVAKQAALKSWVKIIQTTDPEIVIQGATRYLLDPNRSPTYTAHPATWLNAHRWLDDALPVRNVSPEEKREKELQLSKQKTERERQEFLDWQKEQELQRQRSVPPPQELRDLVKKIATK